MLSGPVALLGSRASRAFNTSSIVKLMSHRVWSDNSGSVGVWSGWSLVLNTDVKYSLNIDGISAGLELNCLNCWVIEILSAILKITRHGGQSRERL